MSKNRTLPSDGLTPDELDFLKIWKIDRQAEELPETADTPGAHIWRAQIFDDLGETVVIAARNTTHVELEDGTAFVGLINKQMITGIENDQQQVLEVCAETADLCVQGLHAALSYLNFIKGRPVVFEEAESLQQIIS